MRRWVGLSALALGAVSAACGGTSRSPLNHDGGLGSEGSSGGGDSGMPPTDGTMPGTDGNPGDGAMPPTDGSNPPSDGGPGVTYSNSVVIYVEPGDDADALYNSMSAATTSIHMEMYLLDDSRFIDLLTSKYKAGLDVKVLLNQTFPSGSSTNSSSYSQLSSAGVPVEWAPAGFTYTHEKCVIVDGATAWIMTMNLEYSSPTANREYLAEDTGAADVAEAEGIFEADYANVSYSPSGDLVVAPNNARGALLALIATAKSTLDIEDEEFSDYEIAPAVAAAAMNGVATRLILSDDAPSTSQTTAVSQVKAGGAEVVVTHSPYIHAKAIIVDGAAMYVGSENLSTGSLVYNRELGIITSLSSEIAKVQAAINTDFSAGTPQ